MNKMLALRSAVPNLVTSLGMLCGLVSIHHAFGGHLVGAAWFIVAAACLDAMDGRVARWLKVAGSFGVQYDSLADLVSFGVAPAVLLLNIQPEFSAPVLAVSFLYLLAGAFRLARFNLGVKDVAKKGNFTGLPIPAAALSLASYVLWSHGIWGDVRHFHSLLGAVAVLSLLMVSTFIYPVLPGINVRTVRGKLISVSLLAGAAAFAAVPDRALFILCSGYVVSGIVLSFIHLFTQSEKDGAEPLPWQRRKL